MTYLDWGCEPLREECQSCLDALCSACQEDFKMRSRPVEDLDGLEELCQDLVEPDCDRCDIGKKPGCDRCTIIYDICRDCADNARCEFRITGLPDEDRKKKLNGVPDNERNGTCTHPEIPLTVPFPLPDR